MKKMCKEKRFIAIFITIAIVFAMMTVDSPNNMSKVNAMLPPNYLPYGDICIRSQSLLQGYGWQDDDEVIGTPECILEGFKMKLNDYVNPYDGFTRQYGGWLEVDTIGVNADKEFDINYTRVYEGEMSDVCGFEGGSIYGVSITIHSEMSRFFHVRYRVYTREQGWQPWVINGKYAYVQDGRYVQPIEMIEVELEAGSKGPSFPEYPILIRDTMTDSIRIERVDD